MPARLYTISEAAHIAGVARTTIQRWVKAGRLKKTKGGTVSLAAVERCKAAHAIGRPYGKRGVKYESLTDQLSKPFLRAEGLRRLRKVLQTCAFEWGFKGKAQQFRDAIADALPYAARGERYAKLQRI